MFIPNENIDTLYNYLPLFKREKLAELPNQQFGTEVAIVGAGAAGLVAGYELLKMGLKPVIYEASNRIGGRLYSKKFEQVEETSKPIAELGAMRIPKSSHIFFYYANQLGLSFPGYFPEPGIADTLIHYKNKRHYWTGQSSLPSLFTSIQFSWKLFMSQIVTPLHTAWQQHNMEEVRQLWQMCIDQYKDMSFYEVLRTRSPLYQPSAINLFGEIGFGAGGYNSIYQISFLEILRVAVNNLLNEQTLISEGIEQFSHQLYHAVVNTPQGLSSLAKINAVKLNTPIVGFDYNLNTNNPILKRKHSDSTIDLKEYAAVIFTGSTCAAHIINITNRTSSRVYLLENEVMTAIKNSWSIPSSKTFICTEKKFWLKSKMPKIILTDDLPRAIYFLDYPNTQHGVVCLSYTWGPDSLKLHAIDPKDRVIIFKRIMEKIDSRINKYLVPLNDEVISIDWTNVKYQNGAFKLSVPGNDYHQKHIYFQFQTALSKNDKGVYLAGDSVSWLGGWIEGAMHTSINAVFAVAKRLGAKIPPGSPLEQNRNLFNY